MVYGHQGSLPGTLTTARWTSPGIALAAFINTRKNMADLELEDPTAIPEHDLFESVGVVSESLGAALAESWIPVVAKGKARALAIPRILSDTERRVPGLALKRLLQAHPKLRFELDAIVLKHHSLWYTQLHSTTPDDRRLMGWQARLHGHLLKIAALLALSASWQRLGKEHPQISLGHLMFASRILAEIHPGLVALVTSSSATNFGAVRQKVMVAVSRAKREGLTRGALLASVHVRPRELDETLESLVGAKEVTVVAGTPGHPEARYRHAKYRR